MEASFRLISVPGPLHRPAPRARPAGAQTQQSQPVDRPSTLRVLLRQLLFIPDPEIFWIHRAYAAVRRELGRRRAAVILCSGPPFSVFILGRLLKLLWGTPLVLDYRDVWQDHPWWPAPRWRRPLERWMERRILAAADLVVANHEPMLRGFLRHTPWIAERSLILPNGFDPKELGPPVRPTWRPGQRFEIVYAGTLYRPVKDPRRPGEALSVQRPVGLFEALRDLSQRGSFGDGGVRMTFVGAKEGTDESANLRACAREWGVADLVEVLPRVEKSEVVPILRRAHLLLNILYYTEAQVAQKVYDYLHLEIPVLSLLRASEANASIVRRARAGPVVDPADARGISRAIEGILRQYASGQSPLDSDRAYIDRFGAPSQAQLLDTRLRALVDARRGPMLSQDAL